MTGRRSLYMCEKGQMDWISGPVLGMPPGADGEGGCASTVADGSALGLERRAYKTPHGSALRTATWHFVLAPSLALFLKSGAAALQGKANVDLPTHNHALRFLRSINLRIFVVYLFVVYGRIPKMVTNGRSPTLPVSDQANTNSTRRY